MYACRMQRDTPQDAGEPLEIGEVDVFTEVMCLYMRICCGYDPDTGEDD